MKNLKVLALDIGAGTEDILLYDDRKKSLENCVKMVLPSPSQVFAAKVREATRLNENLYICGDTIGGGAFAFAVRNHVDKGLRVVMAERAAYTVRNDLDEVRKLGIEVVSGGDDVKDFGGKELRIEEINLMMLQGFLGEFDESLSDVDVVAVGVQDHGRSPKGIRNRRFRIQRMKESLTSSPNPETLAYREEEIPSFFIRMKSAAVASKRQLPGAKVLLMDTAPAAIFGCLNDPLIEKANPVLVVNVGNAHIMAAIVLDGEITAVIEHHTRLLDPQVIERLLINFADGNVSNDEVFKEGGHGVFFLTEPPGFSEIDKVAVTGPNRSILAETNLSVHSAAPGGDVMMTGPVGLVEATKRRFRLE